MKGFPMASSTPKIELSFLCRVMIDAGAPIVVGPCMRGTRRVIPIVGGTVEGKLNGRVLSAGADFQTVFSNDVTELHARYVLELDNGDLVYVENTGFRYGAVDAIAALNRGEDVDPELIYFRTAPRFETNASEYLHLNQRILVASGVRRPERVELTVFEVL